MPATHVAFIMYPVTDMSRAVEFYEETLGLKKDGLASDVWVEFDVAGTTFGIGNFEQVGTPGTGQSLALEVRDLDAFVARLRERGVVVSDPYDLTICRISTVHDPDGNQVRLHETAAGR